MVSDPGQAWLCTHLHERLHNSTRFLRTIKFSHFDRNVLVGIAGFALSLVLLYLTVWRRGLVGLADNLDYARYTCRVGLISDSVGRSNVVPTRLIPSTCDVGEYWSSFIPMLWVLREVNSGLGIRGVPLSEISLVFGVIASVGWGLFVWMLVTLAGRRPTVLGLALGMLLASTQVTFSSYFGSAYGEAVIFAVAPWMFCTLLMVVRLPERRLCWLLCVIVVGTVALTKPAAGVLFITALVAVVITLTLTGLRPNRVGITAFGVAAIGVLVFAATAQAPASTQEVNRIDLVFTAILPNTDNAAAALRAMGVPAHDARVLAAYSGQYVQAEEFDDKVTQSPSYDAFRDRVTLPVIARYLAGHPRVVTRMVQAATDSLPRTRVDYLANFRAGDADGRQLASRPEPTNLVVRVLTGAGTAWIWLLWLLVAVVSATMLARRNPSGRVLWVTLMTLALLAAMSLLAALGDGFHELAKHLVIAAYFNALLIGGLVGLLLGLVIERAARHRCSPIDAARGQLAGS